MPERLNGLAYRDFLNNELPALCEEIPLQSRSTMWFQQDGAPPHYSVAARTVLNRRFPNRWIGRAGPICWPPRSPDLNPLDYFLWGHIKSVVYRQPINNEEELKEYIKKALDTLTPELIRRSIANLIKRVHLCIQEEGGHFQHLL